MCGIRVLANLLNVDEDLAERVADGPEHGPAASRARPPRRLIDMDPSPALRIIGKYPETLEGRAVGILVADGADGAVVDAVTHGGGAGGRHGEDRRAAHRRREAEGRADAEGRRPARRHAVGAVRRGRAGALGQGGWRRCWPSSAAVEFVVDAFGHLKAIGSTAAAQPLLDKAGVAPDERVVPIDEEEAAFIRLAAGRQWDREPSAAPAAVTCRRALTPRPPCG